ncbi:site-specific DNA-methyltransferase [Oscillibacter sp. MSJ-2]|uniref:Site-specific DNA-methyltransferase n=1 Tax=Dysosmobacter acutus TaxID=2841504 RepID=A0ABS6F6D6_9FIRM|nr:site-specific DNA-methyltransferase [Dysosmobacter acutus]MBU5625853.1 site-specific DNA-methyltransferase [Dysosmobacter acutus]
MDHFFIKLLHQSSEDLSALPAGSVDLVVTSPPYPMIGMWDECFADQCGGVGEAMAQGDWDGAYGEMHRLLDQVWLQCDRVLRPSGFVCINIGDATRTLGGTFRLFSNHARIIRAFESMGYSVLPDILWRKQSNSPNKFMGSGMYPAGAYVTYEHEYILVFRKGAKRRFSGEERQRRRESAYFWEERNLWFSDLWEFKGTAQQLDASAARQRSGSFPLELPLRLVAMYSIYGDTVLDPFGGLGTTALACASLQRSCVCCEREESLWSLSLSRLTHHPAGAFSGQRLSCHLSFIEQLSDEERQRCYVNLPHGVPVKTRQETELRLYQTTGFTAPAPGEFRFTCAPL